MLNRPIYIFLFLLLFAGGQAQNLVPNASFEMIDDCDFGFADLPTGWVSGTRGGTPDMYHTCAVNPNFRVPNILSCEYQTPRTGEGYAGIIVYGDFSREYLQIELTEALEAGQTYLVAFYVAPISGCNNWRYTDQVGLAFADRLVTYDPLNDEGVLLTLASAIEHTNGLLDDVGNWTSISGCYEAKGGEKAIIIGSFRSNNITTLEAANPDAVIQNYLFVDDVSVLKFDPLPDTVLLCEEAVTLTADFLDDPITWSTGVRSDTIVVKAGGDYSAQVNLDGCVLTDSTFVFDPRTIQSFVLADTFCVGTTVSLNPEVPGIYQWSDGSKQPFLQVSEGGVYSVVVDNECDTYFFDYNITAIDCGCNFFVPNIFSPNQDQHNDQLAFYINCDTPFTFEGFSVFDRWGNLVFYTIEQDLFWEGDFLEKPLQAGNYVWQLEFTVEEPDESRKIVETGTLILVR
ncbi:MAG: gliding motility-associated C-terminal domain-containing protein [Bacteroidota bacterium]